MQPRVLCLEVCLRELVSALAEVPQSILQDPERVLPAHKVCGLAFGHQRQFGGIPVKRAVGRRVPQGLCEAARQFRSLVAAAPDEQENANHAKHAAACVRRADVIARARLAITYAAAVFSVDALQQRHIGLGLGRRRGVRPALGASVVRSAT